MIKEIAYSGIDHSKTDLESENGELAELLNMEFRNGSLFPVVDAKLLKNSNGYTLIHVHATTSFKNYIFKKVVDNKTRLYNTASLEEVVSNDAFFEFPSVINTLAISHVGNTLIICANTQLFYFILKNNTYTFLGNKIPDIEIHFQRVEKKGVRTQSIQRFYTEGSSDEFAIDANTFYKIYNLPNNSAFEACFAQMLDTLNSTTTFDSATQTNKYNNRFNYPFFLRFALKLYDGTYTSISAPIFIHTPDNSKILSIDWVRTEIAIQTSKYESTGYSDSEHFYYYVNSTTWTDTPYILCSTQSNYLEIFYAIQNTIPEEWYDVVKSIDIFMSSPIRNINVTDIPKQMQVTFSTNSPYNSGNARPIPGSGYAYTEKKIEDIKDEYLPDNFYLIKTIDINDIEKRKSTQLTLEIDNWDSLLTNQRLKEDYLSQHSISAANLYVYNNKLHLINCKRNLFKGYNFKGITAFVTSNNGNPLEIPSFEIEFIAYIKTNHQDIIVKTKETCAFVKLLLYYYYYPDPRAYKVVINVTNEKNESNSTTLKLNKHPFLNGAYFFNSDFSKIDFPDPYVEIDETENTQEDIANILYVSEMNNPFIFNATGIYTFQDSILNIATTTKELSQGQFGQFPLYVFTSSGIWAMDVASNGIYTTKQPVFRDVCNNPNSIIQANGAIAFTTENGIKLIEGSSIIDITETLINDNYRNISDNNIQSILTKSGFDLVISDIINTNYKDFIKNSILSYDYTNHRIIVNNVNYKFSLIYNIKSSSWSKSLQTFCNIINDYPYNLYQDNNFNIYQFTNVNTLTEVKKAFIITRPIKLEWNILSTIYKIIQRGSFIDYTEVDKGVNQVIFASRDGINYTPLMSSTCSILNNSGSGFKYYYFIITANLEQENSIYGASIDYKIKQFNKLR